MVRLPYLDPEAVDQAKTGGKVLATGSALRASSGGSGRTTTLAQERREPTTNGACVLDLDLRFLFRQDFTVSYNAQCRNMECVAWIETRFHFVYFD